jgi:hypothetical protein
VHRAQIAEIRLAGTVDIRGGDDMMCLYIAMQSAYKCTESLRDLSVIDISFRRDFGTTYEPLRNR